MPDAVVFFEFRARKKKGLDDPIEIIPFEGQKVQERSQISNAKEKEKPVSRIQYPKEEPKKPVTQIDASTIAKLNTQYVSIKKTIASTNQKVEDEAKVYTSSDTSIFTFDELKMAWNKYAFLQKENNKVSFHSTLTKREPKLINQTEIHFELDNQLQKNNFDKEQVDLVSFLRKELKNGKVSLHFEVLESQNEDVKFQTNKDKFKKLAESNKHLETMRKKFNLDIEL